MRDSLRTTVAALFGLTALLVTVTPLRAQAPEDEQAVREVIERLFDAMRAADTTAMRSFFHPEARLATTSASADNPPVRFVPIDTFLSTVGSVSALLDERLRSIEVRVDDNLATAWTPYDFYLGEEFSHCGVNAFQLVRMAEGWQVFQVADTRRQEGCGES